MNIIVIYQSSFSSKILLSDFNWSKETNSLSGLVEAVKISGWLTDCFWEIVSALTQPSVMAFANQPPGLFISPLFNWSFSASIAAKTVSEFEALIFLVRVLLDTCRGNSQIILLSLLPL